MLPPAAAQWDVSPDGSRFLLAMNVADPTPPPFTVLINWQSVIGR
jgi:hypothetical protein